MSQMQRKATFVAKVVESIKFRTYYHDVVAASTFNFLLNRQVFFFDLADNLFLRLF